MLHVCPALEEVMYPPRGSRRRLGLSQAEPSPARIRHLEARGEDIHNFRMTGNNHWESGTLSGVYLVLVEWQYIFSI